MPPQGLYHINFFINCPFSLEYQKVFRAIVFSIYSCGFRPRCALEISDSSENRLAKIANIVEQSQFGIHDISYMKLDPNTKLARFNMPFELGLFFGAKRFGSRLQKQKIALVLDHGGYRYRAALSDISGQDIAVHKGNATIAIRQVRDWLDTCRQSRNSLPGGDHIAKQYTIFSRQLPVRSNGLKLNVSELTYADICRAIEAWLKDNA